MRLEHAVSWGMLEGTRASGRARNVAQGEARSGSAGAMRHV